MVPTVLGRCVPARQARGVSIIADSNTVSVCSESQGSSPSLSAGAAIVLRAARAFSGA